MLKEKPPVISLEQEAALSQLLPRAPLHTSQALGWQGIQVQHHRQPTWEMPEHCPTQHVLIVHHSGYPTHAERTLDGRRHDEQVRDGSVAIVPAQTAHKVNWNRETDVTLICLEPTHLAHIVHEAVDGDRVELIPQFIPLEPFLYGLGLALNAAMSAHRMGDRLYAESLVTALSLHLLRHYCTRQPQLLAVAGGLPPSKLKQAIAYMHAHLSEDLSLEAIAAELNMSTCYFCRLFKRSLGISPYRYLIQQRVERAKSLLKQESMTIMNIALECGFGDQSHFTVHFRKLTGMTPNVYRSR